MAFVLLCLIGGNMLKEGLSREEEKAENASFGFKDMLLLAVATSVDALAVGNVFGLKYKNKAEVAGGIILILIGLKILLEHLGVINF